MRRREFITLLGGAATWPIAARAQQADRMRRIGFLVSGAENDPEMQARIAALRQGLQRLGWSEGRNLRMDYRFATANTELAQRLAKELTALEPELIVAIASSMAAVMKRETRSIPVVFVGVADPVGSGLVASLARPGGNLTGLLLYEDSIAGKWLGMLKEIAPGLTRVGLVTNPRTTPVYRRAAQAIAPSLSIDLAVCQVETAVDIERAIEDLARVPNSGLLVPPDITAVLHRDLIIALAARHRLPAVYQARFWVAAGGLMSYGADRVAEHRHAAYYIDRILRRAKPADLPVEAPAKFETVVNLKTANALGLTVPAGLLVAADEVIE